jgi:hypothetical protein
MAGDPDLVDAVERAAAPETREAFDRRVREQAERIREDIHAGRLDTDEFAVGMELEAYTVGADGRLAVVPDAVFDRANCGKELGVHNVELNSPATVFDAGGVAEQADSLRSSLDATADALDDADLAPVLDAMWTIPPAGGTDAYLGAATERDDIVVADHMRSAPRYVALDNEILERSGGRITLDVPGASLDYPTILVESLATSIQPHLQIPETDAFPTYFNLALRTLGPVLSLATNSPFLPADCYDDDPDVIDATPHELRVYVFEDSINAGASRADGQVRFPRDLDRSTDVVDRVVADVTYAPVLVDEVDDDVSPYRATIPEYDRKRGIHWRWVRGVVGGQPVGGESDGASLRLEYRPLPTQPTLRGAVSLQVLVAGLLRGLVAADHPLVDLPWAAARDCFYDVVAEGPTADLAWVTADAGRVDDSGVIYDDLFTHARRGLREAGLSPTAIDDHLAPIERRRDATVPSAWKKARVREAIADGATLPDAIERMQRAYIERAGGETPFVDW